MVESLLGSCNAGAVRWRQPGQLSSPDATAPLCLMMVGHPVCAGAASEFHRGEDLSERFYLRGLDVTLVSNMLGDMMSFAVPLWRGHVTVMILDAGALLIATSSLVLSAPAPEHLLAA